MSQIFDLKTHPERWITPADLAGYWNVSIRTVRRLVDRGIIDVETIRGIEWIRTDAVRQLARPVGQAE